MIGTGSLDTPGQRLQRGSRFTCVQRGYHRTERASRLLVSFVFSFCFLKPAACVRPASFAGWITGEKRRPQSERPKQGTVPGGLPLPFLTLHFLLVQMAIPKKLGFVVSSPRPKASPALPYFFPKVTSFSPSREPDLPQIIVRKGGGRSVPTTKGDPGCRDRPTGSVPELRPPPVRLSCTSNGLGESDRN